MEDPSSEAVSLLQSRSRERCMEFALVLIAMNIRCNLVIDDGTYDLQVEARDAPRAREQIRLYVVENKRPNSHNTSLFGTQDGLTCAWLYAMTILIVYIMQRDYVFGLDWAQLGMNHAGLVRDGEWWRVVTALSLHVDTPHLVSNFCFGILFAFLAGEMIGWGLAWTGMISAGALGNTLNALAQPTHHASIGASTAIFATVGILAAFSWSRRTTRHNRWVPLGGGVALLAFVGMEGARTDIFAHVTGFAAGCAFGFTFSTLERYLTLTTSNRRTLGIAAAAFFVFTWILAARNSQSVY